jgi:hypothetical protein
VTKNNALIVFSCVVILLFTSPFATHASPPSLMYRNIRIAVKGFETHGSISKEDNVILTDYIQSELNTIGGFDIIYRTSTKKVLDDLGTSEDICSSVPCLVNIGKLLNVDKIITGTIGKTGRSFTISIQIVDIESARKEAMRLANYEGAIEGLDTVITSLTRYVVSQLQIQDAGILSKGGSHVFDTPDFSKSDISVEITFYGSDDTKNYNSTASLAPVIISLSYDAASHFFLTGSCCYMKGNYTLNVAQSQSITNLLKKHSPLWGKGMVSYGFGGGGGIRFWRLRGGVEVLKYINADTDLNPDMSIGVYGEVYVLRYLYLGLNAMMFNLTGLIDPAHVGPSVRKTEYGVHRSDWGSPTIITLRAGLDF